MEQFEAQKILEKQRKYFQSGVTLPVHTRIESLKILKKAITQYEEKIVEALKKDLGKSKSESYMCEIGLVKNEISYMLKHVRKLSKEKRVRTPLAQYVSRSYEKPCPYGNVLIMSPWNYPFLLTLDPLVDAIAAGNTAVIKPSAYSKYTSEVIKEMIEKFFQPEYVCVVTGGREENECLLNLDFDYIFFTGSPHVGRVVMAHAAKHLIPITLELGGKSPCIVDKTANIKMAAKRIVFGKYVNCGQTCVAPDYIYCDVKVKEQLIQEIKKEIGLQFGSNPLNNENYGKIINEKHFKRLIQLIDKNKIVMGGKMNSDTLQIEPTVFDHITWDDAIMQEEIFGPLLPILTFQNLQDVVKKVNSMPSPLACYMFSSNKENIKLITERVAFGGGCINDTLIHLATSQLGFGGVGESGMGSYHGKYGFETFTHKKSIVDKKTWLDLPMRYQPYQSWKDKLVRMFVR